MSSFTEDLLWEVVEISDKGQGMVAKANLSPGTLILEDIPLFTVPWQAHTDDPKDLDKYLAQAISKLSVEETKAFFSLADSKSDEGKTARGIYFTNCYTLGNNERSPTGMLPRLSRSEQCLLNCIKHQIKY